MFRPSVFRPITSPLRYYPLSVPRIQPRIVRYQALRHESHVRVQRVRFVRHLFTTQRLAWIAAYTTAFYVWLRVWNDPLHRLEEQVLEKEGATVMCEHSEVAVEGEEDGDEESDEYEIDEDDIFIPLGLMRERPRQYYKGTDPEWQEFIKLAKDNKRQKKIRDELASQIRHTVAQDKNVTRKWGEVDVTQGRYWLDMLVPEGPPKEYERSGILITDTDIRWGKLPVSHTDYLRIKNVMWPTTTFTAAYETVVVWGKLQALKIKEAFGLAPPPPRRLSLEEIKEKNAKASGQREASNSHSTSTAKEQSAPTTPSAPHTRIIPPPEKSEEGKEKKINLLPNIDITKPSFFAVVFLNKYRQKRDPYALVGEAPRGSVVLTGMVELKAQKGRCVLHIVSFYDVKSSKFIHTTAKPMFTQSYMQRPRGGSGRH